MRTLALLAVLSTALASSVGAQTITGRVTADSDGIPLRDVSVELLLASYDPVRRVATDDRGRYRIDAPVPGDYRVVADHLGYLRLESPLAAVRAGDTVTIDFELPVDPVELEGIEVEVDRLEQLRRRVTQYGVRLDHIGARFVRRSEIERRSPASNLGQVLQWQNVAGISVKWTNLPPSLCVQAVVGRDRCAIAVLDGSPIDHELAASMPLESLEAVVILTPEEATLSFGTDGGGGAVLLFTRASVAR